MTEDRNRARFSYDGLERTIHEKARLGLLTSLVSHPKGLSFVDLKRLCDLTDGNLSRHIKVLQDAGLVTVEKGYENNRPHTHCTITAEGQKQFFDYLAVLEKIVKDATQDAARPAPATPPKPVV
ncbi:MULTISPECIES: transcriptional regulator [Roseovarius]|uniref:Transcriptional regulator n=1 Tax=Roseovarius nubinhibens TaxID=314263 RepID=A0A348WFZ7_9RHOB|nr:transcriptional regulator [Roseovarius nubinhibens]|tara:strand:+ start:2895 stop:3266 length:372 start_codon:yes stop_codon:yes gene_type:complete